MVIEAKLIIALLVGLAIGSVAAWFLASRYYRNVWLVSALKAKNPEIWDLAHFVLKEEEEQKKERGTDRVARRR